MHQLYMKPEEQTNATLHYPHDRSLSLYVTDSNKQHLYQSIFLEANKVQTINSLLKA